MLNTQEKTETLIVAAVPVETIATNNNNRRTDNTIIIDKNVLNDVTKVNKTNDSTQPLPVESTIISVVTDKHYLIAGVFKIKENAQSMLLHLRQLGFTNTRIIEANNRSYVSYEEFVSRDEALALADSLHSKNLDGWIWKH